MLRSNIEIVNPDGIDEKFLEEEIIQCEREKNRKVSKAEFHALGDGNCSEKFWFQPAGFERIRRITGYLVGTLDSFNDAKRAEERDRVKHSL